MIDLDDMVAAPGHAPKSWQAPAPARLYTHHKPAIGKSPDLDRILALPRRPQLDPESDRAVALVELMNRRYARPRTTPCTCAQIAPARFKDGKNGCIRRLNVAQSWGLFEIGIVQGLEGAIGVGHGKTVLDLLAPLALADAWAAEGARAGETRDRAQYKALLLMPPGLVDQLDKEYDLLAQHFRVPSIVFHTRAIRRIAAGEPTLHVYPYSKLSTKVATTFLGTLRPHAIIADEAHHLGDPKAVRTGRALDYLERHANTPAWVRFCNWTGSLTNASLNDYAHLINYALRERSPLPRDRETITEWSSALDPTGESDWQADPGALLTGLIEHGLQLPGEHVYVGFNRRLVETLGYVGTRDSAVDALLEIIERTPEVENLCGDNVDHVPNVPRPDRRAEAHYPDTGAWPGIRDALTSVRQGQRPDGEELIDPLSKARCARELASGFFYRWIFPRGETESLVKKWREARKAWRCEIREKLEDRAEHLDSPYLCQLAAMRHYGDIPAGAVVEIIDEDPQTGEPIVRTVDTRNLPAWNSAAWPAWRDIMAHVKPKTEPVWIDEFLARDAAQWAREHRGIVWYDHTAFGSKVAELAGLPMHGGGEIAGPRLVGGKDKRGRMHPGEDGSRSIVVSIKSHGTGRDGLQRIFHEQLIANPMSSNDQWEQLLGRLHRVGQLEPVVRSWFYRHSIETRAHVDKALRCALYVQGTLGSSQKLRVGFGLRE